MLSSVLQKQRHRSSNRLLSTAIDRLAELSSTAKVVIHQFSTVPHWIDGLWFLVCWWLMLPRLVCGRVLSMIILMLDQLNIFLF
jgi:hypothetical protein